MGTGSFPGVKWPWHGVDHPPLYSAEVKERVELYLYLDGLFYDELYLYLYLYVESLSAGIKPLEAQLFASADDPSR
jgi:hypothetical protein